ncbi:MAG: phosphatase PAP2 family protein [Saprospiraceae bacterium]
MRFALLPAVLLCAILPLKAQPFSLDWKREAWIGGAGMALLASNLGLSAGLQPLDPTSIALLNPKDIGRFDRSAAFRFSPDAGQRSFIALASAGALASAAGLLTPSRDWPSLALIWLETNLTAMSGTLAFKNGVRRVRPFVYNPAAPLDLKTEKDARRAFFSGHTSLAAANTFFAAQVFEGYFPESRLRPLVWGLAATIPAWTAAERYLAGKHFPSDLLAGYAFGALCGWLIPRLHRQTGNIHLSPISSGIGLSLEWQLD